MQASIEYLNELSDRFPAAEKANLATEGRRGSLVEIEDADFVVLAGDLHNNRAHFHKIVKAANLEQHPRRQLVLQEVIHGGAEYPSGGCTSHMMLEDVAKLKLQYPNRFHFLLCNHEASEAVGQEISKAGRSENQRFARGLQLAYGPAAHHISKLYHRFILSCPLAIRLPNGVFISHTVPDPLQLRSFDANVLNRTASADDLRLGGAAYGLLWGRASDEANVAAFLKLVGGKLAVNGHEPCPDGFKQPNNLQLIFDASGEHCYICVIPGRSATTVSELVSNLKKI